MAKRGRKPKPTPLKIAEGNPGKRPLNEREPKAERGEPKPPTCLDRTAKAKWKELAPLLDGMGVLTIVDGDCLAAYCQAFSEWVDSCKAIAKEGLTVLQPPSDREVVNPMVHVRNIALKNMALYGARLGLSPSDRSRIQVLPADDETSELTAFLEEEVG